MEKITEACHDPDYSTNPMSLSVNVIPGIFRPKTGGVQEIFKRLENCGVTALILTFLSQTNRLDTMYLPKQSKAVVIVTTVITVVSIETKHQLLNLHKNKASIQLHHTATVLLMYSACS